MAKDGRVLVVEDEFHIRHLLNEGLSAEGFRVRIAAGAEEALQELEQEEPDVVLLDLMLPGINGIELAKRIHERWEGSIIAMSASNTLLSCAGTLPFVRDTIPKPFEWDSLVRELHSCVAA